MTSRRLLWIQRAKRCAAESPATLPSLVASSATGDSATVTDDSAAADDDAEVAAAFDAGGATAVSGSWYSKLA